MADPLAVVNRQVEAFNAHDLEGFLDTYAADAVVDGLDPGGAVRGHGALRRVYGERFTAASPPHCTVRDSLVLGGRWVVAHELITSAGRSVELVGVFEVAAGRIVHAVLTRRHPA